MPTSAAFAHAGGCGGIVLKNSTEKSAEPAAGRIRLYEEPVYLAALVMLSLAVAMTAAAVPDFRKGGIHYSGTAVCGFLHFDAPRKAGVPVFVRDVHNLRLCA